MKILIIVATIWWNFIKMFWNLLKDRMLAFHSNQNLLSSNFNSLNSINVLRLVRIVIDQKYHHVPCSRGQYSSVCINIFSSRINQSPRDMLGVSQPQRDKDWFPQSRNHKISPGTLISQSHRTRSFVITDFFCSSIEKGLTKHHEWSETNDSYVNVLSD